jgi:hypothetical protein
MSHQISQQHPAVVLRSHYVHMRALLVIAMIAVVGLTVTVVLLVTRENSTASASLATPVTSSVGAGGTSAGGGPIDPGYGYGGHPERGYRGALATADLRRAAADRRSSRPDRADWQKIKNAVRLRTMALAPHHIARFRAFAAELGLRELVSIHPLAPGRCATAAKYLYNNLLDLDNAFPHENWTPLRRAVAKEPSIEACAPRPSRQHHA